MISCSNSRTVNEVNQDKEFKLFKMIRFETDNKNNLLHQKNIIKLVKYNFVSAVRGH